MASKLPSPLPMRHRRADVAGPTVRIDGNNKKHTMKQELRRELRSTAEGKGGVMFELLRKVNPWNRAKGRVWGHNFIDASMMSRFVGKHVVRKEFHLEEDLHRSLAPGVTWRRRRFRFIIREEDGNEHPEGLCINEVILDYDAQADLQPVLAGQYPHLAELPEIQHAYWSTTFARGSVRSDLGERQTRLFLNTAPLFFGSDPLRRHQLRDQLLGLPAGHSPHEAILDCMESFDPALLEEVSGGYGIVRYLPAFPASRLVQAAEDILAATNGGFFLNFPEEYDDGISSLHQPVGGHMVEGRLIAPPWIVRPGLIHFENGGTKPGIFGPGDLLLHLEGHQPLPLLRGLDAAPGEFHGTVWRRFDRDIPSAPAGCAQIYFSADLVIAVDAHDVPRRPIPAGGALVRVGGDHARMLLQRQEATSAACVSLRTFSEGRPQWMASAGPFLVRDSKVITGASMLEEANAGEFRPGGPAPVRFSYDTGKTAAPRTAVGTTAAGGHKIVAVDGRRAGEHSCGLTLDGLAHLMKAVGCDNAINLDGGGSTVMAVEGATWEDMLQDNGSMTIVNIPSDGDGQERALPSFLMVRARP